MEASMEKNHLTKIWQYKMNKIKHEKAKRIKNNRKKQQNQNCFFEDINKICKPLTCPGKKLMKEKPQLNNNKLKENTLLQTE